MTGCLVLGQRFNSIQEVFTAVDKYGKEQGVPYTIFNCKKAETYNKDVDVEKRMPVDQRYKEMIVACKHYGKPRQSKHKEGTKQRGNQRSFKKFCTAKVNFNYNLVQKCHIVSKIEEAHCNHSDDVSLFRHYPESRRANQDTVDKVNMLFENEAKTHRIRDVLLNSGVMATGQDIQNLRNKWLASCKGKNMSDEGALFNQLEKLKDDDPNSVVVVHYDDESNVIQSIFFQTSYMRESLEEFPELLIMDTTYKLCDNEMPLIVFSVVDCFGVGRIAGYSIIFSETKQIVSAALEALKLGHDKLVEAVTVVYVDKAQSEIAALKQVLPGAEVHLCDFHIKDTFRRLTVKNLVKDKSKWDAIEKEVMSMIHSHTKEDYDKSYEELKKTAADEHDFMNYFNKNWHNCELVWCDYQRNESFTLGERTTGRVESHNAKVKKMVDKKYPVPEVIFRLCVLNRNSSIENSQRIFNEMSTTKYHKYSRDPVVQKILRINTPFVGKFLQAQYERSLEPPSDSIHKVTLETCDCKFYNQSRLPCSHIFRKRRLDGAEVYDHKLIPKRWTVIVPSDDAQKNFSKFEILTSPIKSSKIKKTMTQEERYNLADSIGKRISSYVANFGGEEFHHRINALKDFEDLVRLGKRVAVVGINGEGQPDNQGKVSGEEQISEENSETNKSQPTCDDLGENIFVSAVKGQGAFHPLTSSVKDKLKLARKCPVPGRPKAKRVTKAKTQSQKQMESDEDDPDKVILVNEDKCEVCDGPVTRFTSCSKGHQGHKYILCENKTLPACKDFHKWISSKDLRDDLEKQQDCVVCAAHGPPTVDGAHKCNTCGNPVHAFDGMPCCSIATDPEEEGYGTHGRTCLKCVATSNKNNKGPTSSITQILNGIELPTIALDSVAELIDKTVTVDLIDESPFSQDLDPRVSASMSHFTTTQNNITPSKEVPVRLPNSQRLSDDSEIEENHDSDANSLHISDVSTPDLSPAVRMSPPVQERICFGCQAPAVLLTAKTPKNYGRRFYACGTQLLPKCKWMNWLDKATPKKGSTNRDISSLFQPPSSLNDGLDNTLSKIADEIDPICVNGIGLNNNHDLSSTEAPVIVDGLQDCCDSETNSSWDTTNVTIRRANVTIRRKRALSYLSEEEIKPKLSRISSAIEIITIDSDSDSEPDDEPVQPAIPADTCAVCQKGNVDSFRCACCQKHVHAEECSLPNPSSPDGRICKNCFCRLCKKSFNSDHVCQCHICDNPAPSDKGVICYRCERICHPHTCSKYLRAKEKLNEPRFICEHCHYALKVGISPDVKSQITNNEMLSDEHIVRASIMLAAQFQGKVDGFCTPMGVIHGNRVETPTYYPRRTLKELPWVQILNTGQQHWVTAILLKGSSGVKIMDSLRHNPMTSHAKIQVAMLAFSQEKISIGRPACMQQENGVDCGLFAIANATEFCFSNVIQYVDFHPEKLRSHWLKCLEEGLMRPFPRNSKRPKKSKEEEEFELVKTYCSCRLPESYGNLILCKKCAKWYHRRCAGIVEDGEVVEEWCCTECASNM